MKPLWRSIDKNNCILIIIFFVINYPNIRKIYSFGVLKKKLIVIYKTKYFLLYFRQLTGVHKGSTNIPLPGSALPARRCPPDKVRPVAGSSRASSPGGLSMIPRAPPTTTASPTIPSPYQTNTKNSSSMLDKLKLFKSNGQPDSRHQSVPVSTPGSGGKRTSSSSGVSSARSER